MERVETPGSEAEVAAVVRDARAKREPMEIVGGGTRRALGRPVRATRCLSTSALAGIPHYEPGALTLVAASGTPLAQVNATLSAEGQRLSFEPTDHRRLLGSEGEPTIGAVAACNISGPRRILTGACRDSLIGVRFVDGTGASVKNGGRVMKNVTGYDLTKLVCGSWGTLGVLTEVSVKVQPVPERAVTLFFYNQMVFVVLSLAVGLAFGDGRFANPDIPAIDFLFRAWVVPSTWDLTLLVILGMLSASGGYMMTIAYMNSPSNIVAPFEYVALIMAVFWSIAVWQDYPDFLAYLGIGLILMSGLIIASREATKGIKARRRQPEM